MDCALARRVIAYAGTVGLNDGRFAFVMFALDLDVMGTSRRNLSLLFEKGYEIQSEEAFESTLLISINNKVTSDYLEFVEDVKLKYLGPPFNGSVHPGHAVSLDPNRGLVKFIQFKTVNGLNPGVSVVCVV